MSIDYVSELEAIEGYGINFEDMFEWLHKKDPRYSNKYEVTMKAPNIDLLRVIRDNPNEDLIIVQNLGNITEFATLLVHESLWNKAENLGMAEEFSKLVETDVMYDYKLTGYDITFFSIFNEKKIREFFKRVLAAPYPDMPTTTYAIKAVNLRG